MHRLFFFAFTLSGCLAPSGGGSSAGEGCEPNLTQRCLCSDGTEGVQSCREDGLGWSACACLGGTDAQVSQDATQPGDAGPDARSQGDARGPDPDASGDPDARVDLDGEPPTPDAEPEPDAAVEPDLALPEGTTLGTLEDLLAAEDGPLDLLVRNLYVTYLRGSGYYVQARRQGPAAWIFIDPDAHNVDVGHRVALRIRQKATSNGAVQVEQAAVFANDQGQHDVVALLAQDLAAAGEAPGEGFEHELVRVADARKVTGGRGRFQATYAGITSHFEVFDEASLDLCQGATFDLRAGVIFEDAVEGADSTYYARSFRHADLENVDEGTCPRIDDSNWGFERWTLFDPVEDFDEDAGDKLRVEPDPNRVHEGNTSAQLISTYSGADEAELSTAHRVAIAPGGQATCRLWVYDDDPDGRVRLFLTWWDEAGVKVGASNFAPEFSEDAPAWSELVLSGPANEGATRVTCGIRLYALNELADDGRIVLNVDDLRLTTP